jgi:MFS family permease
LANLGIFIPFTFIIVAARGRGVPEGLAKYLVAILNASSTFGRTVPNYFADRVGRFTVFVSFSLVTTIFVLAIWLPVSGVGAIVTFTVLFGFSSGAVFSLLPACLAQISDIQKIGVRSGVLFSVNAVAVLIGSPIAGELISHDKGGFRTMQGFSGAMLAGGFTVYLVLWVKLGGFRKGTKV